jgi:cation diffusion facilitator CzcD-associated flavoprotein CzcO
LVIERPKVVVIGAGPYGLTATRYLSTIADVTTFEAKETVGGVWYYTDVTEETHPDLENDPFYKLYGHLHSSMYKNLSCNIPKWCMTFKDFPHDKLSDTIMMQPDF